MNPTETAAGIYIYVPPVKMAIYNLLNNIPKVMPGFSALSITKYRQA